VTLTRLQRLAMAGGCAALLWCAPLGHAQLGPIADPEHVEKIQQAFQALAQSKEFQRASLLGELGMLQKQYDLLAELMGREEAPAMPPNEVTDLMIHSMQLRQAIDAFVMKMRIEGMPLPPACPAPPCP
jgi:hypothetical protein